MNADSLPNLFLFWLRPKAAPAAEAGVAMRAETKSILLMRNQVMTITDISAAHRIQVQQGAVWLTGTPGEKDVVLQAEESICLTNHYPFVIEALADAEIALAS